jgi:deoxycytidine triphosphate deaminase
MSQAEKGKTREVAMIGGSRVEMVKTLAPVEIPNGILGTVTGVSPSGLMGRVVWDNGYVLPMYDHEVIELADELF